MAQLSLYMDDAAMEQLRADAKAANKSVSAYARQILENRKDEKSGWVNGWPPGYFENLSNFRLDFEVPEELPLDPIPALDEWGL